MDVKDQLSYFGIAFFASCVLTIGCMSLAHTLSLPPPGLLEIGAVFTSFGCTLLFVLQRRQAYLWGVVTTLLYAELFRQSGFPASAAVQLYLLGALVYGFFRWGPDGDTRPVSSVTPPWWWLFYLGLTGVTWYGASLISASLGSPLAGWDAAIMAASILAQWLLDNKKIETWIVWIAVNAVAVPVYWIGDLQLVSAQYVLFGLNSFFGLYMWWRSMQRYTLDIEARNADGTPVVVWGRK